jgi:hypothetical protein
MAAATATVRAADGALVLRNLSCALRGSAQLKLRLPVEPYVLPDGLAPCGLTGLAPCGLKQCWQS